MIDLQVHSFYSDGSDSPADLVKKAKEIGLSAIALTDHDTVDGIPEFLKAAEKLNLIAISGVEISVDAEMPPGGHLHLLGLFINHTSTDLIDTLHHLKESRKSRAFKILEKLQESEIEITPEELKNFAENGAIGRPHIARLMVEKGYVTNTQEAFAKYLKKGGGAYVEKTRLNQVEALGIIREAEGLSFLAHPHLMNFCSFEAVRQKIMELKSYGLNGVEAYYPEMPVRYRQQLTQLARDENLLVSGGSDYHGKNKEGILLGSGSGNLHVPDSVIRQLNAYRINHKINHTVTIS